MIMTETSREEAQLLWSDILDMARGELSPAIIPWLERLLPLSLENQVLSMAAPSRWAEKKVMTEYRQDIEGFIKETTLEDITLSVTVDPEAFKTGAPTASATTPSPQATAPTVPAGTSMPAQPTAAVPVGASTTPLPAVVPATEQPFTQPVVAAPTSAQAPAATPSSASVAPAPATPERQAWPEAPTVTLAEAQAASGVHASPIETLGEELTREGVLVSVDTAGTVEMREGGAAGAACVPAQPASAPAGSREALSGFTFDTFIVGEANKMAFEAARNVAEDPNAGFNPLFLYSKPGLGKTHLLMAIKNYIDANRPGTNAVYCTSSKFVSDFVDETQNKKLKGLQVMKKYFDADVLLVDDVQMFSRSQGSVSAFFDVFNRLTLEGRHIVLAADEPPDYLNLDERVRTRFGAGMVLDIAEPSYELKRQILATYYLKQKRDISWFEANLTEEDLDYIAEIAPSSIREMQGFLMKISTMSASRNGLTRAQIKAVHDELFKRDQPVEISTIIRAVALERGVDEDEIRGKKQTKAVSRARQECMWLARQLTDESYQSIGSNFGRDHSTVYNSISKIDSITKSDRSYQLDLEDLKKLIRNR